MTNRMKPLAAAAAALLLAPATGFASPGHSLSEQNIGQPGDISHVDRVIPVEMGEMYFSPEDYTFEKGETVVFMIKNAGQVVHEFNIGTEFLHEAHAGEMTRMMEEGLIDASNVYHNKMREAGMMHLDANAVLVEPGSTAALVWTFSGDADMEIACNIPGHREGGMVAGIGIEGAH